MKSTALSKCIGDVFFSNNEEYKVSTKVDIQIYTQAYNAYHY